MAILGKRLARFLRSSLPAVAAFVPGLSPLAAAGLAGGISAAQGRGLRGAALAAGGTYLGSSLLSGSGPLSGGASSSSIPSFLKSPIDTISDIIPSADSVRGAFGLNAASDGAGLTAADNAFLSSAQNAAGTSGSGALAPGLESFLKNNKELLTAGGVGAQYLMGNKESASEKALKASAGRMSQTANTFMNALNTGQLPAGVEAGIMQGYEAAKAGIRNKYANLGLSGSTMEQQELSSLEQRLAAQRFDTSLNLAKQGMDAAGIADSTYQALMKNEIDNDSALQEAIARLAGGAGYGTGSQG